MLLGNPDRLACPALGWRGNPDNLRYCTQPPVAGRMVAIDAVVQRRPPGAPLSDSHVTAKCTSLLTPAMSLHDHEAKDPAVAQSREPIGVCHVQGPWSRRRMRRAIGWLSWH